MQSGTLPTPVASVDQLVGYILGFARPASEFRIGAEAEKFGVYADGRPIPYAGDRGVHAVLERLAERHDWALEAEHDGGAIIALSRGKASITLEPGGQLELSGAPQTSIHATCAEFRGHMAELAEISRELGIQWLGLGFHPFARQEDLDWVPKARYAIMREYLPTQGKHALDMMRRTATVQANVDFADEHDLVRKLRTAMGISSIVTAIFANSPIVEGKPSGYLSYRSFCWLDTDPDRSGILPFVFEDSFDVRRYVEWALDVPMFLVKRGDRVMRNTSQTFRVFLKEGIEGHRANLVDWEMHLNTLFPEVRLKRTIEVRGADSLPTDLTCALPALWKGILYDGDAMDAAWALVRAMTIAERETLRAEVPRLGLGARLGRHALRDVAKALIDVAYDGLKRLRVLSRDGNDESVHLDRLREMIHADGSPAEHLLARWRPDSAFAARDLIALTGLGT